MGKRLTRKGILEEAIRVCTQDRQNYYGEPENSFGLISSFWSTYLNKEINPKDVAIMMGLLKVGRMIQGSDKLDNYVDAAAYMAIAGELGGFEDEAVVDFFEDEAVGDFDVVDSVPAFQAGSEGSIPSSPSTYSYYMFGGHCLGSECRCTEIY